MPPLSRAVALACAADRESRAGPNRPGCVSNSCWAVSHRLWSPRSMTVELGTLVHRRRQQVSLASTLSPIAREVAMWIRQCELDVGAETLPIPSRIASNEEFIPPPPTPQQKQYESRLKAISAKAAK